MSIPNGSKILLIVEGEHPEVRVAEQAESLRRQFPGTQVDVTWDMQDPRIAAYQADRHVVMILQPSSKGKTTTSSAPNALLQALRGKAPPPLLPRAAPRHPFQRFLHVRKKRR